MNLSLEIKQYALSKAKLTEEEYKKSLGHDANCRCNICGKFGIYHNISNIIEEWELHKRSK